MIFKLMNFISKIFFLKELEEQALEQYRTTEKVDDVEASIHNEEPIPISALEPKEPFSGFGKFSPKRNVPVIDERGMNSFVFEKYLKYLNFEFDDDDLF